MTLELTLPENAPQPGTYRHYKGPLYQVLGMAQHSETDEWMVVYQALYGQHGFWLRPLSLWLKPVDTPPVSDAPASLAQPDDSDYAASVEATLQTTHRFSLVTPSNSSLTQLTKSISSTIV